MQLQNEGLRVSVGNRDVFQRRIDELERDKSQLQVRAKELDAELSQEREDRAREREGARMERERYNREMTSARAEVTRLLKIIEQLTPAAKSWEGIGTCNPVSNGRPGHKSIPDDALPGLLKLVACNAMVPALREAWRAVLIILFPGGEGLPDGKFGYIPGETFLRDLRRHVLPTVARCLSAVTIYGSEEIIALQTDGGQVQQNKSSGSVLSSKLECRDHGATDRSAASTRIVTLVSVQATNGTKGAEEAETNFKCLTQCSDLYHAVAEQL